MKKLTTPGIRFITTTLCNYKCKYCHNEWEPKLSKNIKLDKELIEELIISAKALGAKEVDITGGEPLINIDYIEEILQTAKKEKMWTNITTNGFFLLDYCDRLRKAGLKEIHVHVPSLDKNKYNHIVGVNSSLKKVLKALKLISNNKYFEKIMVNIPINCGVNAKEIYNFIVYFNKLGIIPRFIEGMQTKTYDFVPNKITFEELITNNLGAKPQLINSYLWGINEYNFKGMKFETLRCICFDRKCKICYKTNFLHIDQLGNVRACNLRAKRTKIKKGLCFKILKENLQFLSKQKNIPAEYKKIWGNNYLPLYNSMGKSK